MIYLNSRDVRVNLFLRWVRTHSKNTVLALKPYSNAGRQVLSKKPVHQQSYPSANTILNIPQARGLECRHPN